MTDDLNVTKLAILNSPDITGWPATAQITRLDLTPDGVHIEFTGQNDPAAWPDIPFGQPGDSIQFTLWIALQIAGTWWAAGCIEFWRGLAKNGGPVDQYAKNWYYDPNRWTPMTGHQPAPGEKVGFLITSGDARHQDQGVGVHERSNIVVIDFPDAAGRSYTWPVEGAPAPAPVPPPAEPPPVSPPVPAPAPAPGDLAALQARVQALENRLALWKGDAVLIASAFDGLAAELTQIAGLLDNMAKA